MKISRIPPDKVDYIVITGDGGREFDVLTGICCKYRDKNKILWFPRKVFIKRTGLEALDVVKNIPSDFNMEKIIYTVDRDVIEGDIESEIIEKLKSVGIEILEVRSMESSCIIDCKLGAHRITLYCIVAGIDVCIEEQIVELLHEKHGIEIDTSGEKNSVWKKNLKRQMLNGLNHKDLTIEELISTSGIDYIKSIFPNFCSIFDEL
jgi:hypothetical protein